MRLNAGMGADSDSDDDDRSTMSSGDECASNGVLGPDVLEADDSDMYEAQWARWCSCSLLAS